MDRGSSPIEDVKKVHVFFFSKLKSDDRISGLIAGVFEVIYVVDIYGEYLQILLMIFTGKVCYMRSTRPLSVLGCLVGIVSI